MSATDGGVRTRVRRLAASVRGEPIPDSGEDLVCHCRKVPYAKVEHTIECEGARSLADIQVATTACTRCFGCRFELERLLSEHLGDDYRREANVTLPTGFNTPDALYGKRGSRLRALFGRDMQVAVQRMYIPVLSGFRGDPVRSRVIIVHWHDPEEADGAATARGPIPVRADLMTLRGERLRVWESEIAPRTSAVIEIEDLLGGDELEDGVGTVKVVIEGEQGVGSLRPYFQFETPTSISSTHEKKASRKPNAKRQYYWLFPIAPSPEREEAYLFCTNTHGTVLDRHELVWEDEAGAQERVPFPRLELDQSAFVPLHEHFPAIAAGDTAGTVRIDPPPHLAGWMMRLNRERGLWRVQHL